MRENWRILTALALIGLSLFAALYFFSSERERQQAVQEAGERPLDAETQMLEDEAAGTREVTLYFYRPGAAAPGRHFMRAETVELLDVPDPILMGRQIIGELFTAKEGRVRLFPQNSRLRQIYILGDGTAIVDLAVETVSGLQGGITSETAAVESISRSLIGNLEEVKRVLFLVEGKSHGTLKGHLSGEQAYPL